MTIINSGSNKCGEYSRFYGCHRGEKFTCAASQCHCQQTVAVSLHAARKNNINCQIANVLRGKLSFNCFIHLKTRYHNNNNLEGKIICVILTLISGDTATGGTIVKRGSDFRSRRKQFYCYFFPPEEDAWLSFLKNLLFFFL